MTQVMTGKLDTTVVEKNAITNLNKAQIRNLNLELKIRLCFPVISWAI